MPEAANDAWGPTGKGGNAYSAYDVIKAIRVRGGVETDNGDAYLESVKGDKDKMAQLIRNERRIELCFENKYVSGTFAVGKCLWTRKLKVCR